jgi:OFA family oxalate/formate antiporter-like MFS transporter
MDKYVGTRWSVPFAGFLLAFAGGFSYAWGVFVVPMIDRFEWTIAEAALPFTVFMAVFATMMVPAGKFQDIFGPRKVSVIGAILFLGPTDRLH